MIKHVRGKKKKKVEKYYFSIFFSHFMYNEDVRVKKAQRFSVKYGNELSNTHAVSKPQLNVVESCMFLNRTKQTNFYYQH